MKHKKIFSIGGATFDIFIKASDHRILRLTSDDERKEWLCLEHGGKVKIEAVQELFGGGAANTSIAFARQGFEAAFVGKVGHDHGEKVIANLANNGVDVRYVKKTGRDKTAFSTIINTFDGDRTVLAYSGANRYFTAKDLPLKPLADADWIFLNHLTEPHSRIPAEILKILNRNRHIKLAWNPGHEQIEQGIKKWRPLLERTELLFLNKHEASRFTRTPYRLAGIRQEDPKCFVHVGKTFLPPQADDVSAIFHEFFKTGVKKVIITDGRDGAQASDGRRVYYCPAASAKRVDTLGAGDAFSTGFAGAIIRGLKIPNALKYGTINATSVVSYYGAQTGLLSHEEQKKQLKGVDICVTSAKLT